MNGDVRHSSKLILTGAMASDVGAVREHNEDAVIYSLASATSDEASLIVVCDGMGGAAAGEVASSLATEVIRRLFAHFDGPIPNRLGGAIAGANTAIMEHAEAHPECHGMGTTCTAVAISGNRLFLGQVGDSRAYLLRGNELVQLSEDQTLVAKMVREKLITAEQAQTHPQRNIVLQALGTRADVIPHIWAEGLELQEGDLLLVCSDGLTTMVGDTDIARILRENEPDRACEALVAAANLAGGDDNISVGVFRVETAKPAQDNHRDTRRIQLANYGDTGAKTRQINLAEVQR